MRKLYYLLLCMLLISSRLIAQEEITPGIQQPEAVDAQDMQSSSSQMQLMATGTESPESFMTSQNEMYLQRQVSSMVDYYTGTAKIQIPLYTIESYGIQLPISLNYSASGIKIDDYPSWVGSNWNLSGGGRINRMVRGQPDDTGYMSGHGSIAAGTDWNTTKFQSRYYDAFDGEPDVYFFELPTGQSGMFVIDYNKNITLIPYQDIKVQWLSNTSYDNSYFSITDANGIIYTFGSSTDYKEKTTNNSYARTKTYVSSWLLQNIKYNNKTIAQYTYVAGPNIKNTYDNYLYRFELRTTNPVSQKLLESKKIGNTVTIASRTLKKIQWDLGSVEFVAYGDYTSVPTLNRIEIFDNKSEIIKYIYLDISKFGTDRSRLERVYEGKSSTTRDICSFQYYGEDQDFPGVESNAFDTWGYYNGETSYGYSAHTIEGHSFPGATRAANLTYARIGTIQKIRYPNGGWTEFEYESHKGHNTGSSTDKTVGGLRIKQISEREDANSRTLATKYYYDQQDGLQGGELYTHYLPFARVRKSTGTGTSKAVIYSLTRKPDAMLTDHTGSHIVYPAVKEVLPNGSYNIYKYRSFNDQLDFLGSYKAMGTTGMGTSLGDSFYKVPYTSTMWGRGMLKEVTRYKANDSSNPVYREIYTYDLFISPKSTVYSYPLFQTNEESDSPSNYKGEYQWTSKPVVLKSVVTRSPYSQTTTKTYNYASGMTDIIPRETIDQDSEGNTYKTTVKYPQDYNISTGSGYTEGYALLYMKSNGYKNAAVETVYYRNNEVIGAVVNRFRYDNTAPGSVLASTNALEITAPISNFQSAYLSGTSLVIDSRYNTYSPVSTKFNSKGMVEYVSHIASNNGTHTIYGYEGMLPIATVYNVPNMTSAFHTSFEDYASAINSETAKSGDKVLKPNSTYLVSSLPAGTYSVSYWRRSGTTGVWSEYQTTYTGSSYSINSGSYYIDELRIMPANASMTTCTYRPGVGKTSETDANGNTTYYRYNDLGMLISIVKDDGTIVKKLSYTY